MFRNMIFLGSNIPKEVEIIVNSANDNVYASFDNDEQRAVYRLGVQNTLSVLTGLLNENISNGNIVFYYPKAETSEEMSIKEIIEWINSLGD